jgi:hypothetical protein
VKEIDVQFDETLNVKHGDLHVIQGEVFKCRPKASSLAHCPLILKRLETVDRRTYDLKVYEADTFQRFRGHPNIVSLYSYWSEPSSSPYVYKTLVLLYEEGVHGDMAKRIVNHVERDNLPPWRPSTRTAMRYLCDIAKGLIALHNCKFIHGRIKPSSIFLDAKGTCMLGEMGKVELDSARHTHHFFSKLLIGEAIPRVLVYWAPELLRLEKYGTAVDLWALGVCMYELVTGEHPFPVDDEVAFRESVLSGSVNWQELRTHPMVEEVVRNLIRVNPEDRWTAHEVLAFGQAGFTVEVQRCWRGYKGRKMMSFERQCAVQLQSTYRSFSQQRHYKAVRANRRQDAAVTMQMVCRRMLAYKNFMRQKKAMMRCQANVLTRLQNRSYDKMRTSVLEGQKAMRTYLATKWYLKVRAKRQALETRCRDMQLMMERYEKEADDFYACFPDRLIPMRMRYLASFETWQLAMDAAEEVAVANSGGAIEPIRKSKLNTTLVRLKSCEQENAELKAKMVRMEKQVQHSLNEQEDLQRELGPKYADFQPMVERLKSKLCRLAQMCEESVELPVELAHQYNYSQWDLIHEPDNRADNVLEDSASQWKTLSPHIDLALNAGTTCFVAKVDICSGDCGPNKVIIHTSRNGDDWAKHNEFECTAGPGEWQEFKLQGEPICSFIRISMPSNVRGGSYVSVQQVKVIGLVQDQIGVPVYNQSAARPRLAGGFSGGASQSRLSNAANRPSVAPSTSFTLLDRGARPGSKPNLTDITSQSAGPGYGGY